MVPREEPGVLSVGAEGVLERRRGEVAVNRIGFVYNSQDALSSNLPDKAWSDGAPDVSGAMRLKALRKYFLYLFTK